MFKREEVFFDPSTMNDSHWRLVNWSFLFPILISSPFNEEASNRLTNYFSTKKKNSSFIIVGWRSSWWWLNHTASPILSTDNKQQHLIILKNSLVSSSIHQTFGVSFFVYWKRIAQRGRKNLNFKQRHERLKIADYQRVKL